MFDVIKHTPLWVFALFVSLVLLGLKQAREREVTERAVYLLTLVMVGLSIFGVYTAFSTVIAFIVWFASFALGWGVTQQFGLPTGVRYFKDRNCFRIPDSKIPLILMMVIFFTKYSVAVMQAKQLIITQSIGFLVIICILYGVLSGVFVARGLHIFKARNNNAELQPT